MSENNYIGILLDALTKKTIYLEKISELCELQENALKEQPVNTQKYKEALQKKQQLSEEVKKLDDGFVAVYDRVAEELKNNIDTYRSKIRDIQTLIKKITELTAGIESKETRINAEVKKLPANSLQPPKQTMVSKNAASKYEQVMKRTAPERGSVFINKKQ